LLGAAGTAHAKPWWMRGIESNETDFLPPMSIPGCARIDGSALKVRWVIADGYYLYKQKFEVKRKVPIFWSLPAAACGVVKTILLGTQKFIRSRLKRWFLYPD